MSTTAYGLGRDHGEMDSHLVMGVTVKASPMRIKINDDRRGPDNIIKFWT